MVTLFAKWWIPDRENTASPAVRQAYGALCGLVGIFLNLLLFCGKLFAGTVSGSIAITADAFNNLSDAGSSIVTLLGFKLAGQKPDAAHPFGHGRIEYLSGLVVSGLILIMGFELGKTSMDKILHPQAVEFSWLTVVILAVSILTKAYMSLYNRSIGTKIRSTAMAATAADSLSDCMATGAVLLATLAGHFFQWKIDGWCGAVVALLILYAGFNAARDTIQPLLGQAPAPELVRQIQEAVLEYAPICGIHDLVVHDYGPGRMMITLHAEVPCDGDLLTMHDTIDLAEHALQKRFDCAATIHMDPIAVDDVATLELKGKVRTLVEEIQPGASIHDFRIVQGPTHTNLIFDVALNHDYDGELSQLEEKIGAAVEGMEGNYFAVVQAEYTYV